MAKLDNLNLNLNLNLGAAAASASSGRARYNTEDYSKAALLQPEPDVDTAEDLRRLAASLIASDRGCPRTRFLLGSWGWLNAEPAAGTPA